MKAEELQSRVEEIDAALGIENRLTAKDLLLHLAVDVLKETIKGGAGHDTVESARRVVYVHSRL